MRCRPARLLSGAVALAALGVLMPALAPEAPLSAATADAEAASGASRGSGAAAAADRPAPSVLPDYERPLRIMVVGDSISHGQSGSATWRYWLWRESLRQGTDIRMVGPNPWPNRGRTYEHLDHGFEEQRHHAAVAGTGYRHHIDRITDLVHDYDPDVVLTELGFNDLDVRRPASARETARSALRYTRAVLAADPDVRLVLSQIPSTSRKSARLRHFAKRKNALAAQADRRTDAKLARLGSPRVTRTDLRTDKRRPWRPARYTFDGSHPNSVGETVLAQHFAEALHEIGVLPAKPRVFRREAWEPRPRFNAAQHRPGVVKLWWGKDARRIYADTYVALVRVGTKVRRFRPRPGGAIRIALPAGRYRVRMVARRGTMTSRPGPLQWVEVPAGPKPGPDAR